MTTGKTIGLTRRTFIGKVMSLLFNVLSRLVITFLPRSKVLLISWLQTSSAVILEPLKINSHCFPSICHEVMGMDAMILVFWMLSFKPTFSLSSFTFIKRIFSSSSLSARRVVSSAYLRLLMFPLAILIPACASSSAAVCKIYSVFNLNYPPNAQLQTQSHWGVGLQPRNPVAHDSGLNIRHSPCSCSNPPLWPSSRLKTWLSSAGAQPRWIQGIQSGDGVGEGQETTA